MEKKTAHASEQERPDILKRREDWFEGQLDLDPEKLVFIDESVLQRHGRGSL
jgi:putative transposase